MSSNIEQYLSFIINILIIKELMLKQPSTNVKMTNVATIRYKINNRNFQIACYRNKAMNWRNGVENDVSEVLQSEQIFQNASHGTVVKKADLNKFFPNKTKIQIIEIILSRGELQITDKERDSQSAEIFAEIIKIIVEKCVHPVSNRRFSAETIKQAVKQIHFSVKTDQTAKKQALECIKLLQTKYKIGRGNMRIKISLKKDSQAEIIKQLNALGIDNLYHSQEKGELITKIYDIQPNKYRELSLMCKKNEGVTVEVVLNVVVNQSTKQIENDGYSFLELIDDQQEKQIKEQKKEGKDKKGNKDKNTNKKVQQKQKVLTCSTCGQFAIFSTAADQRSHFKTQWHVGNVKRKSKNLPAISEEDHMLETMCN